MLKARQVRCWRKRFSEANGKIQNYYLKLRKKILTLGSYVRLSFPFLFKLATFDVKRPALFDSLSKAHCNFEPNRAWAATYQEKRISWKLSRLCLTITMTVYGYLGTMAETALKYTRDFSKFPIIIRAATNKEGNIIINR